MFLYVLFALFACVCADDTVEPKFQVLTPDELMVQVPHHVDKKLVTFRMGVRRKGSDMDDLEIGENEVNDNRVFIHDERLNLKEGDVVNYLLVFRDRSSYQAQSGNYHFNGVYYKKPFNRHRFRRDLPTTTDDPSTSQSQLQESTDETEEFDPTASRFGGGGYYPHHGGGHHGWPHHGQRPNEFNPFGSPRPSFNPYGGGPNFGRPTPGFGGDCNDHRHDRCHGSDTERWMSSTAPPFVGNHDLEYHCKICGSFSQERKGGVTTSRTTTTEEYLPDIDIRFSD